MAAAGAGASDVSREAAIRHGIPEDQADGVVSAFRHFDADSSGGIDVKELKNALNDLGETVSEDRALELLTEADLSADGEVQFDEFCKVVTAQKASKFKTGAKKAAALQTVSGAVGQHSYSDDEKKAFSEHVNHLLGEDEYLKEAGIIPIDGDTDQLFEAVCDGILLCKLMNQAVPDTVDERTLNRPKKGKSLNPWEVLENINLAINSARSIGCHIVNIHANDLAKPKESHTEHLVLGLVWQVIQIQLLRSINLKEHPEIVALLQDGEEAKDLMNLPAHELVLRWLNYHMAECGCDRRVSNFSSDLKDSVVYVHLLNRIAPSSISLSVLDEKDPTARAAAVIDAAKREGVPTFIQPGNIARGNRKLNLAFCAQVFNTIPGLSAGEDQMQAAMEAAGMMDEDTEGTREQQTYKLWMNSLGLENGEKFIHSFDESMSDGLTLLQVIEKVAPQALNPRRYTKSAEKLAKNPYKKIENCNYIVEVCKALGLKAEGIGGVDIANRNSKLIQGIVWQLMRLQVINVLKEVGGGTAPKDGDIVRWANERVAEAGKETRISSFRDRSISNSVFLLDLLKAVEPRAVNDELCTDGETEEDAKANALYVLSVARKLGCTVFLTWKDIVEVKSKMIMTLVASIMHLDRARGGTPAGAGGGAV